MTTTVRCKVVCHETGQVFGTVWDEQGNNPKPGVLYRARFTVVYGNSPENKTFFASTPTGSFELGSVREMPWEPGKSYYIDFSPAE